MPSLALRLLLGEMSDLLVTGQRAIPARALEMGFRFTFTQLDGALNAFFTDQR
jgi:NAD dependent epimerase/dehydratase family enzyme